MFDNETIRCWIDGAVVPAARLSCRTMNFGQHWRTPSVREHRYVIAFPRHVVVPITYGWLDFTAKQASGAHPEGDPSDRLHQLLKERGFPSPEDAVLDSEVLRQAIVDVDWEILQELVAKPDPHLCSHDYMVNTVDEVEVAAEIVRLSGMAGCVSDLTAYQDL